MNTLNKDQTICKLIVKILSPPGAIESAGYKCAQIFQSSLASRLEELFNNFYSFELDLIKIERIVIDLGIISCREFESEFSRRFLEQMGLQLQSLLSRKSVRESIQGEQKQKSFKGIYRKGYKFRNKNRKIDPEFLLNTRSGEFFKACLYEDFRNDLLSNISGYERVALCYAVQKKVLSYIHHIYELPNLCAKLNAAHSLLKTKGKTLSYHLADSLLLVTALCFLSIQKVDDIPLPWSKKISISTVSLVEPWFLYFIESKGISGKEIGIWKEMLSLSVPSNILLKASKYNVVLNKLDKQISDESVSINEMTHLNGFLDNAVKTLPDDLAYAHGVNSSINDPDSLLFVNNINDGFVLQNNKILDSFPEREFERALSRIPAQEIHNIYEGTFLASHNDPIAVMDAGIVLLWPLLTDLLTKLGLLKEQRFIDELLRYRAAHWINTMIWGKEYLLDRISIINVLCGIQRLHPEISRERVPEAVALTMSNWLEQLPKSIPGLESCSVNDIREFFLQRSGVLFGEKDSWHVEVNSHASDFLLVNIPWSLSTVSIPWIDYPMRIEWTIPHLQPEWIIRDKKES